MLVNDCVHKAILALTYLAPFFAAILWVVSTQMRSLNEQARWNKRAAWATAAASALQGVAPFIQNAN
jgi:hypothetical protein